MKGSAEFTASQRFWRHEMENEEIISTPGLIVKVLERSHVSGKSVLYNGQRWRVTRVVFETGNNSGGHYVEYYGVKV